MNLIPIDAGGTPTELTGGDAFTGGDFAALMAGLMTGDSQIVPLIDLPAGEQLATSIETFEEDDAGDAAATILEFIGTPPSGMTISPRSTEGAAVDTPTDEAEDAIEDGGAPALVAPALGTSIGAGDQVQSKIDDPVDPTTLATVHPIAQRLTNAPTTEHETQEPGVVDEVRIVQQAETGPATQTEIAPGTGPSPAEDEPVAASARPITGRLDGAPATPADGPTQTSTLPGQTESGRLQHVERETTGPDRPSTVDVDVEAGVTTRTTETARPAGSVSQPVMVGVARRVEEAIAALATKPDPKIVTLQLDELDGLRITVALRPDGIHLSSTGDAGLTTEIERALASRGFDMASRDDRGRQGADESNDDGWRPQAAPGGRTRATDPSGIRL